MDKNTAISLIEDTFNQKFDENRFELFAKNFLNNLEPKSNNYSGQYIWDDYKEHINAYKRIGKYTDPDGEALDVLIVEVKSVLKLERARTALRNFVIKHMVKFEKDYALVAFYSKQDDGCDWRFSFIKLEHQSYLDEDNGKVKTHKEFTPAKRYSFLVGKYEKAYTAKNQLLPLLQNVSSDPTIEEIEGAFSIEKVTYEFFSQYKELFVKLLEHFDNDTAIQKELTKSNIDSSRFTKKLLGQIVFLYFLQKKGWLGVPKGNTWGKGQKRFIQQLFDTSKADNKNFFKDYLQFLFYEALAKERERINSYYAKFDCRIPFLNGGLFEADYDWENANISIPETLFRNEERNKSGDTGTGILDVFDRYNFTIKEDEPLDKEVAVDPEMLGKVFENMLEVTERKSKGAFYTPREIVHFMCQESLIHYLDNSLNSYTESFQEIGNSQTNMFGNEVKNGQNTIYSSNQSIKVPKTDIEAFMRKGHLTLENDQRVANEGRETRVYKYNIPESIRQHADLIDKYLTEIKICDPAIGSGAFPVGLLHELVNAHLVVKPHLSSKYLAEKLQALKGNINGEELSESRYIYRLKRHIIQESIYGVDIDASAIDIARLRLWLSLVVDEDDFEPIETLPNLDYKIVCGNSLIEMPDNAMRSLEVEKELEGLKEQFYNETNEQQKKQLRTNINTKIRELLDSAEQFAGYKIDFDFKLFFSEVWNEKGGFDVVIGNPPFVNKINKEDSEYFRNYYKTIQGKKYDLFRLFIEKGIDILSYKSLLTFIVPDVILNLKQASILRKYIIENFYLKFVAIAPLSTFDASVEPVIISIAKQKTNAPSLLVDINKYHTISTIHQSKWAFGDFNIDFSVGSSINLIIDRILKCKKILKDEMIWKKGLGVYSRQHLGNRLSASEVDLIMNERPWTKDYKVDDTFGKEIAGKDVCRYYVKWNEKKWLSYGPWLAFQRPIEFFKGPRIVVREITNAGYFRTNAAFVEEEYFNNQSIFNGIMKINSTYKIKFITALINSGIFSIYAVGTSPKSKRTLFPTILMETLELFPIPNPPIEIQKIVEIFVDFIAFLNIQKKLIEINYFESLVDGIVFELYFPEELKAANKEILKYLGDLKPLDEIMSKEEKLAMIGSEFDRLYDPNHPVRNNLETLDSIEEVRTIKEALK